MLLIPKLGKRKKPKSRAIKKRARFKAHGSNPLKPYHRKRTDGQVLAHAHVYRMERLRNRTRAEMAMAELLDSARILYEIEKIFLNGDRYILVDFYLKSHMLAIEVDGEELHSRQKEYDDGRSQWLLNSYGVRTVRFKNKDVLNNPASVMPLLEKHLCG